MKIGPPLVALITGSGSGIGQALALALSQKGVELSIVDMTESTALETLRLVQIEYGKLGYPNNHRAIFIKCDVSNREEINAAFQKHKEAFGRLDICINCAGIGERGQFLEDFSENGTGAWRQVVDVNLIGVINCTRIAAQQMIEAGNSGTILNLGSAAGLYPSYFAPVYSATKGGVVLFTRSLRFLAKEKIRVNVICPEFVATEMTKPLSEELIDQGGGFIPMEKFLQGAFELLEDERKAGDCLWITNRRGLEYWPTPEEKKKYMIKRQEKEKSGRRSEIYRVSLPTEFRKVIVHTLSHNFRVATRLISLPLGPVKAGHVLVKNIYAGVNASDINYSAGLYFGSKKEALSKLPFDAGFEAVGIVAAVGENIKNEDLIIGSPVAVLNYGGFAEFSEVSIAYVIPIPALIPEVVPMLTSGLTALLGLEEAGKIKANETVLITAAAGGTGQFAVQLAKLAGNKVVATCGGSEKSSLLKKLGADRIIDYKTEIVSKVLKEEFPRGVDLIYESVGGEMFQTCLNSLGRFGRLVIIGMISQYQDGFKPSVDRGVREKLLWKSQSLIGFYLNHHTSKWRSSVERLYTLYSEGKLKVTVDPRMFRGLESVPDAVEYLHSGKSIGKVVVQVSYETPSSRL